MSSREQQRVRYWPVSQEDQRLEWVLRFLAGAGRRVQARPNKAMTTTQPARAVPPISHGRATANGAAAPNTTNVTHPYTRTGGSLAPDEPGREGGNPL